MSDGCGYKYSGLTNIISLGEYKYKNHGNHALYLSLNNSRHSLFENIDFRGWLLTVAHFIGSGGWHLSSPCRKESISLLKTN